MTSPAPSFRVQAPLLAAILATTAALPLSATAQTAGGGSNASPFSFDLSAGYRYNSRPVVPDLDFTSLEGDSVFVLRGGVGLDLDLTQNTRFNAGYSYSRNEYRDLGAFDLESHIGSLGIKHDFGPFDAGLSYHQAQSDLGGRDYLDYERFSSFLSTRFGKRLMLRGTFIHTDKEFAQVPARDATTRGIGADLYWFLQGRDTYLVTGYLHERNDARAAEFDYDAHNYSLRLVRNFSLIGRDARFKIGYLHEQRDYDAVTPSIGVVRDDTRNSLDAELRVNLTQHVFASLEHELNDNSSNLPAADYSQSVTTLRFGVEF